MPLVSPAMGSDLLLASMNEGLLSSPCYGGTERGCERSRPSAWMPPERPPGPAAIWSASGSVVMVRSSAHVSIASSDFEDQVLSGLAPVAHVKNGLSGSQARNGAFRSAIVG